MSPTTSTLPVSRYPAWASLAQIASDDIERLLEHFFSSTDNLLYDLSKRASGSTEAAFYFDAMRELRHIRHQTVESLISKFHAQIQALSIGKLSASSAEQDLSILSGDELERVLACETVISSVGNLYHNELSLLARGMTQLSPLKQLPREEFPLSPHWIAHCFLRITPIMNGKISVIIFKQLEKHLLRQLEPLLHQCNEHLTSNGYLRDTSLTTNNSSDRFGIPKLSDIHTSLDEPMPTITMPSEFALPLHSLRQILANARFQAANDSSLGYRYAFNPGPVVPLTILDTALTQQQKQTADTHQFPLKNQVGDYVSKALSGSSDAEPNALNPYHEDIIQLVGAFFDELLEDDFLTATTQALVCRLQIPVLKVALRNENFFSSFQHPSRTYINVLTRLAQTLEYVELPGDDPLYSKLLNSVKRINKRFELNEDIFASELETLEELEVQEHKRAELIEQRTLQAEEGRARFNSAKEAASECLEHHISQQKLHGDVQHFVQEHWQQVLVLTFLKEGNGPLWLSHGQTLNDLLWLDQEHMDERTQNRANQLRANMMPRLLAGLSLLHLTKEQCELLAAKTLKATQNTSQLRTLYIPTKTAIEKQQESFATLEQEYFNRAKDIDTGTWLSYRTGNEKLVCKLASKDSPNNYLFVNRLGMKKISKTRKAFALDLQSGAANILNREPLFDRIMNKTLTHLKQVNY